MINRRILPQVLAALGDTPVVLLHGARQTGKTTLARRIAEHEHPARYLTLDDVGVLAAATTDPQGFVAGLSGPTVLDEVQRAPNLFLALKAAVDRDRRPGRFLLTGSANVFLLPRLAESLAGRMEIITLWPLSQGELDGVTEEFVDLLFTADVVPADAPPIDTPALADRVLRGGYPEAIRRAPARRRAWFGGYLTTILQRDVRDIQDVSDLTALPRLLQVLAGQSGNLLNSAALSRRTGLPYTTLRRYLALLEATFLVQTLPAWTPATPGRAVKSPKIVVCDTGLGGHVLGLDRTRLLKDPTVFGPLLETFVVMELRKQAGWSDARPALFHFRRHHTGAEVDVVLEGPDGRVVGVEVKASGTVSGGDFKGLRALAEVAGSRFHRGLVLYTGRETVPFGRRLAAVPVTVLWRA